MTTHATPMQMAQVTGVPFRIQTRVNVFWKIVSSRALSGEKIAGSFPHWAL